MYSTEYYVSINLPLLLIPSWGLTIDRFLILSGPGPCPPCMLGPLKHSGPFGDSPPGPDQEGINRDGPKRRIRLATTASVFCVVFTDLFSSHR